ncbi:MAG: DivIVA domain-containing protein [Ancrocorticia sp.]|jgi:DivIVA domain-containing protein|nr:DivIVA domain-containing protein [Ancrocorticia sp.]MCI1895386.1 DivIVA domain-containing protein [Ancrocorticia sp.]MCI1932007.1 DivIVA domain-containing protein [Ancrocorticia sp.]MCI1963368.1 DivIVA domain-containing protein [Ancrocorticia sp.]MCI2003153.1 DivIVA domain-containing protein [Ancrocorticia sp.]
MSKDTFARSGFFSWGYNPAEVDEFLTKAKQAYANPGSHSVDEDVVRNAAFGRKRNGYRPDLVDAALDRLEVAFIQAHRADIVQERGENAWLNETYEKAKTLYPRLLRPHGDRFADADGFGYDKTEVDALIDRLADYFDGKVSLTSRELREATFADAKGPKGYSATVVDVFLERAVSVLAAVE